ncbi:terpenoid synthase [Agrocybe pediades]|nr:terpenoid synthase [Agrocybe pediades]
MYLDDLRHDKTLGPLEDFQRCIIDGTTEPEGEFLQAFRKHLARYYTLFEPIPANGIVLCALDHITGGLLEQTPKFQDMKLTNGKLDSLCFHALPKEVNVDITVYIQVVDDITLYIDLTNDVLSFYKEYLAGERHNYVYNRAAVTRRSIEDTLKDIVEDAIQAHSRVTQVLENSGNTFALDIWRKFVNGFFAFHFTLKRYRLQELVELADIE